MGLSSGNLSEKGRMSSKKLPGESCRGEAGILLNCLVDKSLKGRKSASKILSDGAEEF